MLMYGFFIPWLYLDETKSEKTDLRMHPDSQECLGRDDFGAAECILIGRKCLAGMNWNREMHPDW